LQGSSLGKEVGVEVLYIQSILIWVELGNILAMRIWNGLQIRHIYGDYDERSGPCVGNDIWVTPCLYSSSSLSLSLSAFYAEANLKRNASIN